MDNNKVARSKVGTVLKAKADKTAQVLVERRVTHPLFGKVIKKFKKYQVHDENNSLKAGDLVSIKETKKISKTKSWVLDKVLSSGKEV